MNKSARRLLISILTVVLVISGTLVAVFGKTTSVAAYSEAKPLPTLTGNKKVDFIEVAKSQKGYLEDADGSTVYGKWYTDYIKTGVDYTKLDWCAIFIAWCASKANVPSNVVPYTSMCDDSVSVYKQQNRWHEPAGYSPQVGDLVFFKYGTSSKIANHIGIVYSVSSTTISTYEGNKTSMNGGVGESTYNFNNEAIVGYATPNYSGNSPTVTPTATASPTPSATATVKPTTTPTPTASAKPTATPEPVAIKLNQPTKVLAVGAKGDDVKWVQYCLKKLGYSISIDGKFGAGTQSTLKKAQSKVGIKATGKFDIATMNAIKKKIGVSSAFIVVDTKTDSVVTFNTVTNFKATQNTYNSIKLTWSKVKDAKGYVVVRYNAKTKKYDSLKATSKDYYVDKNLKSGSTYKYKIRAYKRVGDYNVYGIFSAVKSCAARPVTAKAKIATYARRAIKLTWTRQADVDGYQIYRKDSAKAAYKLRKTVTTNKTTQFVNTGLTKNRTYYYRVRSYKVVNGKKVYGAYSNVCSKKITK